MKVFNYYKGLYCDTPIREHLLSELHLPFNRLDEDDLAATEGLINECLGALKDMQNGKTPWPAS